MKNYQKRNLNKVCYELMYFLKNEINDFFVDDKTNKKLKIDKIKYFSGIVFKHFTFFSKPHVVLVTLYLISCNTALFSLTVFLIIKIIQKSKFF